MKYKVILIANIIHDFTRHKKMNHYLESSRKFMRTLGKAGKQFRNTTVDMHLDFLARFPCISNKMDKKDSMPGNARVKFRYIKEPDIIIIIVVELQRYPNLSESQATLSATIV